MMVWLLFCDIIAHVLLLCICGNPLLDQVICCMTNSVSFQSYLNNGGTQFRHGFLIADPVPTMST